MASKMDVDSEKVGVPACAVSSGSVSVSLHPLVIMNISEHWTRVSAQEGKPMLGELFRFAFIARYVAYKSWNISPL